ncbi:MAG: RagB/SusD family nutrient uptake outer membrane protein, partial [Prevotella sp.]|nr:RagB/SusD family nutrient uptake outer membrane protein [Prevotella sp.]
MKKYISILLGGLMMASCVDTVLLPDDKTVDEDFWQSKSDVSMMVNGAYSKMTGADVISKLIVWGGFRSDELLLVSNINDGTRNSLLEIEEVNIETTNAFSAWAPIYSVINNCNIVLQKAEPVMSIDPNYTNGDYETDRSQMLALRALCYFYLVRTFRDVPYTTTAYMNSSQDMTIRQLSPDSVLINCIADLEEAEKNALSAAASGWQRVGWINKEAIHSILADIYLWRASVMHNPED